MCVCVSVCMCVWTCRAFSYYTRWYSEKKIFYWYWGLYTLPSSFYLTPSYTAPVFVSMSVAWQHTACLTDGRGFATVNQHAHSVTIKEQLQGYKHSNYRMLPGITGRHSITFTSSFLCVSVCVCVCVRAWVYRNAPTVFSIIWNGCNLVKYYFKILWKWKWWRAFNNCATCTTKTFYWIPMERFFRNVLKDFDKEPIIPACSNLRGIAQESKIVSETSASFLAFKIHIVSGRSASSKLAYS